MLGLANRLRQDGIDALVDQYNPAPPQGWPQWMTREIQAADFVLLVCTETYLRRVEGQEQPGKGKGVLWEANLIYNLLYRQNANVQKFIPILFGDGQSSSIPLPLEGFTHYRVDTEQGYEGLYRHLTNQPSNPIPPIGQRRSLPPREPQSYPSSPAAKSEPKPPTNLEQRHRHQLLKQVRLDWVGGVLNQSLYKVARLELGLTNRTDAVEQPLNAVVQVPDRSPQPILPGTRISQVFDEQAGVLLILGAPGTGKSTFLFELAQDLLDRAEQDESQPIPVVFPLSSWAARRQPLVEWLIAELNQRSYVPKRVARQWVETEQILPLLDGLDEVVLDYREACVGVINQFRREHGLLPIVVCSRANDYEALGTKLRLRTAVEVQPLAKRQVEDYLVRVGEPLRGLRTALEEDASLWEWLETLLMLWVAMLAYRDVPLASLQGNTVEQRQRHLLAQFVKAMFRRRASQRGYSPEQTKRWLSWLAGALTRKGRAIFYLENLDFAWLPTRTQRWLAQTEVALVTATLVLLIFVLSYGQIFVLSYGLREGLREGLIVGLREGLIVGLTFGLSSILIKLQPVEQSRFGWTNLSSRMSIALRDGLIVGLIFGLIVGLIVGLIRLFTSEAIPETRFIVNQGTYRSVKMALIVGLIVGLIFVLIFGLSNGLRVGLPVGLIFGLSAGLLSGGLFAAKHYALRLFLWQTRSAPLNYVAFLNQAKDLLFLRQVGGGYIFTHRLLREYFASLPQAEKDAEPRAKAAPAV